MEGLLKQFSKRKPRYKKSFDFLFETFARKFGGSEEAKMEDAKSFSTVYEFYTYAFFLGLYADQKFPIEKDEETETFIEFESFARTGSRTGRKDIRELRDIMFAALIAKSDIDLLELENYEEIEVRRFITSLVNDFEGYANYGLLLVKEKYEEDKGFFLDRFAFFNILSEKFVDKVSILDD